MEKTNTFKDMLVRTVAIVGLVAVLVLGAWGIIVIASNLVGIFGTVGSSVTSLFSTVQKEQVVVDAPASVVSGQPLSVAWTHKNKPTGSFAYTVSFSCAQGLSVKAPLANGSMQTVACDTPFNYTNTDNVVKLTPSVTGGSAVTTTFTISAKLLSSGAVTTSGTATVSVTPKVTAANNIGSQPNSTYVPAAQTVALYGLPDLTVRTLSVVPQGNRIAVQFEVINSGTNVARAGWTFNAQLPLTPAYTYQSQTQQALNPGDKIVYTLGFDNQHSQYCTQQYPNYNCNNNYNSQYSNSNCGYKTTYTYNGYANIPSTVWSCDNTNNYAYNNQNNYMGGTVLVTADPYNWVQESAEYNNTANIPVPTY